MSKIIYSKFSNERSPQFAIRTDIIKDKQDQYYVVKAAALDEAKNHVKQMIRWREDLKILFEGTLLEPCLCTLKGEDVEFDFIKGTSIEEILDVYLSEKKYDQIFALIQELFDICRQKTTVSFIMTEDFKKVFGEVELDSESKCFTVSNIDMIFGNVMVAEGKWYLIDYEWCFDFPIPVEYILYRMLHYYVYTRVDREILIEKGIFNLLESYDKNISQYDQMEQNFQKYINGNMKNVRSLYEEMGERTYNIQAMLGEVPVDYKGKNLEIYIDEGMGISQDTVCVMNADMQDEGVYCLSVPISDCTKNVRIDPSSCCCLVQVGSIKGLTADDDEVDLYSDFHQNGVETEEKRYVFATSDPWFMINVEGKKLKFINLTYRLWPIGRSGEKAIAALCEKQNQIFQMYAKEVDSNYHHEQEIKQLRLELEMAKQRISSMEESLSWKLTKPLREVKNKVVK